MVLSGGDYLTFERQKQAHHGLGDGPTPSSRLEGLIPKMEEFHNQAEFLKVIWQHLYSSSSNKSVGTLHAARSTINAMNVTQDPHANYYACSDFMDKVTTSYIVTGGLFHFQMEQITSEPTPCYSGYVGHPHQMLEYILSHAKEFIMKHVLTETPQLPVYGPQSNALGCRYCGKKYVRPKALRKHECRRPGHFDPDYGTEKSQDISSSKSKSSVYQYTRQCLMLGHAIHMGNGGRMYRLIKWFCLYYKASKCPKYAYGLLETQAMAYALLSERQAYRLIWNRTVNHQGKVDSNHPNDLDLEHCNNLSRMLYTLTRVGIPTRPSLELAEVH